MPFGTEKLEWCGSDGIKKCEDIFIRIDRMYERDRHTDTQKETHNLSSAVHCIGRKK